MHCRFLSHPATYMFDPLLSGHMPRQRELAQIRWAAGNAARREGSEGSIDALSGDGGDSTVGAPRLAVQVLGDKLQEEGLPSRAICQPSRLLLLAGHDLKEHSHSRALVLQIVASLTVCQCPVQRQGPSPF